jgi:GntR family transcriptional regulator, transcriptional repressor for pyruvate dehydrogenase complex
MTEAVPGAASSFERLTGQYRADIESGRLRPGTRFASASELAALHHVGVTTARRVHAALLAAGLIEHHPGTGTFVAGPAASPAAVAAADLRTAAAGVIAAFDEWAAEPKPPALTQAVVQLRAALR